MKALILGMMVLFSVSSFAQQKMDAQAVEMFSVLSHPQVQECLRDADTDLVNVQITKLIARCPGCNTYTISGNKRNIDTPSPEKTIIKIVGKAVPGTVGGWIQTYRCDIKN